MTIQLKIVYTDQVQQVVFYPQKIVSAPQNDAVQVVNGCKPGASLALANQSSNAVVFAFNGSPFNGANSVPVDAGGSQTAQVKGEASGGYAFHVKGQSGQPLASATLQIVTGGEA